MSGVGDHNNEKKKTRHFLNRQSCYIPEGVLRISSDGDDQRNFLGFKFSIPGFFVWVGKFGKYFLGWLDLSGDILGIISKQSEDLW